MLPEIEDLAKIIVKHIRDAAIRSKDVQLYSDNMRSPIARRWREAKEKGNYEEFGEMVIADTVDDTLFYLFHAIDEGLLDLSINISPEKQINLTKEGLGELAGWYSGEWRFKYSDERTFDDFNHSSFEHP